MSILERLITFGSIENSYSHTVVDDPLVCVYILCGNRLVQSSSNEKSGYRRGSVNLGPIVTIRGALRAS